MASSELSSHVAETSQSIADSLARDSRLAAFVDGTLPVPRPLQGSGDIHLFILGQDPTVKNQDDRTKIRTCLNLDRRGSMVAYIGRICRGLRLELKSNVYATNLIKNFFVRPPTKIFEMDVLQQSLDHWLPLLHQELASFPNATVISLGEPLLSVIVHQPKRRKLREYWGYTEDWKRDCRGPFSWIQASDTVIQRRVFPFPHQPSLRKEFYKTYMDEYISFVADEIARSDA